MKKRKKILITGCGRSGTKYISELLTQCGFDIKHESEGEDGISSWYMAIPEGKSVLGPSFSEFEFNWIVQQVRNPVNVIPSLYTFLNESWNYIEKYIPIEKNDSPLIRCAKYWYYWNLKAEKISNFTYRVENVDRMVLSRLAGFLGGENISMEVLNKIPKNINKRYHRTILLEEIKKEDETLYENIIDLAKKYGYSKDELFGKEKKISYTELLDDNEMLKDLLDEKEKEVIFMKNSKFWKLRNYYLRLKNK